MLHSAITIAVLLTLAHLTDSKNSKHKHNKEGKDPELSLPLPDIPVDLPLPTDAIDLPLPLPIDGKPHHHHHGGHHPPHGQHAPHPPKPGHEHPPGVPMRECNLHGWWVSEVGLVMYLNEEVPHGYTVEFEGFFYKNNDRKVAATIRGTRTKITHSREGTFGFVVSFPAGQTAVWVGQCYDDHHKLSLETAMLHRMPAILFESWLATKFATQTWNKMPQPPPWFDPRNSGH